MKKIILLFTVLIFVFGCGFKREPVRFDHVDTGLFMLKVNTKRLNGEIKPYITDKLMTADEIYSSIPVKAVINGGFFDMKTGLPISYVTLDGKIIDDPSFNPLFMKNIEGKDFKDSILNRTEFRVLECREGIKYDIARRNAPLPDYCKIKHSLQGGPMILPAMDLEGEYFTTTKEGKIVRQSCDILKRRARTLIGIRGNNVYFVFFTNRNPKAVNEIRDYCKKKRFEKAMLLDGGGSTSLSMQDVSIGSTTLDAMKTPNTDNLGNLQRPVRTFLIIEEKE